MSRLVSINVGLPREVTYAGKTVLTSIFKTPVAGPVAVSPLNLDGDRQSDLSVHGGPHKAVYAYPSEHYAFWREQLPDADLSWGAFGENLTTEGVLEDTIHVGDRLQAGTTKFVVTQPRMPCFKLGIRFKRADMVTRFLRSGRLGFYLSVAEPGQVEADAPLRVIERGEGAITIRQLADVYFGLIVDDDLLRRAIALPALSDAWRDDLRRMLDASLSR